MAGHFEQTTRPSAAALLTFVVVTAVLYLAREVLIPLAVAALFAFLLAPAVRRLEIWGLPKAPAVLIVTLFAISIVAGVGWVTGNQFVSLASKLPEYRENIVEKLKALRAPPSGQLGKAAEALKQLEKDTAPGPESSRPKEAPKPAPAFHMPANSLEVIGLFGVPILGLLLGTIAVIVFTILMLLQRDDLRDRVIRLMGEGKITETTRAMEDAAKRVSRYLVMQLLVNASFGVPLAIVLWIIGIPNAALWGLLATVLRFIPYAGAWIAMSMPIALAFAISDGWQLVAWTAGTIIVLELIVAYGVEPWLYGHSTGLSPLAIVMAVVFWAWLWGPIGLLVATPVTVCMAVIGRHVPAFGFLNVLLGVEPVLPPEVRLYQRLMSFEQEEALELAQAYAAEKGTEAVYQDMLIPALTMVKRDRAADKLSERRERYIYDSMLRILDELSGNEIAAEQQADICLVPAHDEADFLAATALARLLSPDKFKPVLLPQQLAGEIVDKVTQHCDQAVFISAVPPDAAAPASYLTKRLRQKFPAMKIIVAVWNVEGHVERVVQRLKDAGADIVVTRIAEALEQIRALALPIALSKQPPRATPAAPRS